MKILPWYSNFATAMRVFSTTSTFSEPQSAKLHKRIDTEHRSLLISVCFFKRDFKREKKFGTGWLEKKLIHRRVVAVSGTLPMHSDRGPNFSESNRNRSTQTTSRRPFLQARIPNQASSLDLIRTVINYEGWLFLHYYLLKIIRKSCTTCCLRDTSSGEGKSGCVLSNFKILS